MHDQSDSPNLVPTELSCILDCRDVRKRFGNNVVLDDVAFQAYSGSLTSVVGPSGCGKSTLLSILGGLDTSYEGAVEAAGIHLNSASEVELDRYRRQCVGFIFQDFNLIDHLTVLENVAVALKIDGCSEEESSEIAKLSLDRMGLADKLSCFPNELSGGEAQRVAIARAIAKRPPIILADEPTGSLDENSAESVACDLRQLANEGACVVVVTHETRLFASLSDAVIELRGARKQNEDNAAYACEPQIPRNAEKPAGGRGRVGNRSLSIGALSRMALSHMRARMKRVVGAAAVCAIGMLGFGLLLSLLFGTHDYASDLQSRLLANTPVTITRDISMEADEVSSVNEVKGSQSIHADGSLDDVIHEAILPESGNALTGIATVFEGMQAESPDILSVQCIYPLTNDVYVHTASGWRFVDKWTLYDDISSATDGNNAVIKNLVGSMPDASAMFRPLVSSDATVIDRKYDLLGGRMPASSNEVVTVTRPDGSLGDVLLALLGYIDTKSLMAAVEESIDEDADLENNRKGDVPYAQDVEIDDLLSLELAVLEACDYRVWNGSKWVNAWYKKSLIDKAIAQGTDLKVVGVVAPRYSLNGAYDSGYIAYLPQLSTDLVKHANSSPVVLAQQDNLDVNVETNKSLSQEKDLISRILAQANTSGLDSQKLDYLENMSNARTRTLLQSEGIDEQKLTPEMMAKVDKWLADARDADYDQFVSAIESVAPFSLDNGIGSVLNKLDAYGPEGMKEVRVYVDSLDEWQNVVDAAKNYNDLRKKGGLSGISVSYSGEIELFRQAMRIMYLVVLAFSIMSAIVILVTMVSTMGTFVAERAREIGCLRSMGMGRASVGGLFVIEALVIGFIAVVFSAIAVAVSVDFLNDRVQEIMNGANLFKFDILTLMAMILASMALCSVAGAIPARSAAQKDPVAALRL